MFTKNQAAGFSGSVSVSIENNKIPVEEFSFSTGIFLVFNNIFFRRLQTVNRI